MALLTPMTDSRPTPGPERRKKTRFTGDFTAEVVILDGEKAGDSMMGKAANVSVEGVGLELTRLLPENTQVNLVLFIDGFESGCVGTVVWEKKMEGKRRCGIKISHWSYLDPSLETQLQSGSVG